MVAVSGKIPLSLVPVPAGPSLRDCYHAAISAVAAGSSSGGPRKLGDEHRRLISVHSLERVAGKWLAETGRTGTGSAQLSQRLWKQCYRHIADWPNALRPFSGTVKTFSATVRVQSKRMEFRAAATEI